MFPTTHILQVWESELWVGTVTADHLRGSDTQQIGLHRVDVFGTSTQDCSYDTSGPYGQSTGPEDVRLFQSGSDVYGLFWAHPQRPSSNLRHTQRRMRMLDEAVEKEGDYTHATMQHHQHRSLQDKDQDCQGQIIQPFLSRIEVKGSSPQFTTPVPLSLPTSTATAGRVGGKPKREDQKRMAPVEKNWMPFAMPMPQGTHQLLMTWHLYPTHDVLEVDPSTGVSQFKHTSTSTHVLDPLIRLYDRNPRRSKNNENKNGNANSDAEADADADADEDAKANADTIGTFGGAPPVAVYAETNTNTADTKSKPPSYFLGVVHFTRKVEGRLLGTKPNGEEKREQLGRCVRSFVHMVSFFVALRVVPMYLVLASVIRHYNMNWVSTILCGWYCPVLTCQHLCCCGWES